MEIEMISNSLLRVAVTNGTRSHSLYYSHRPYREYHRSDANLGLYDRGLNSCYDGDSSMTSNAKPLIFQAGKNTINV